MPIYEYRCNSCGKELEKIRKISDPPFVDCPSCLKPELVKLVSASSFRLKGSGWYETDFKTGAKKNGVTESDKPNDSKVDSGSEKTSAEKPAVDNKQSTKVESKTESKKEKASTPKKDSKPNGKNAA